jgi:predicted  nucleic acid-binding Zn-ribbon protein
MNITTLTLDERERLAYAEGYTEAAALLAEMADLERERDELIEENDKDRADKLETERDNLQDDFVALAASLQDVVGERDEAQEIAKTYRSALMALEAEVSPAMREFIREVLA